MCGGRDVSGAFSNALQACDFSTRAWTVCAPVPEPRCRSACVKLGEEADYDDDDDDDDDDDSDDRNLLTSVFSYDPRTDQWRSETPFPLACSISMGLNAVAHEGQLVEAGHPTSLAPFALVDDVWAELPLLPPTISGNPVYFPYLPKMASLRLG